MTTIHKSLLDALASKLDSRFLKQAQIQLEKQASNTNRKMKMGMSSSSLLSKHDSTDASKYSKQGSETINSQFQSSRKQFTISNQQVNKAIYYCTKQLPSLHSMDTLTNQCIRHSKAQKGVNQSLESFQLLKMQQLQVFYSEVQSLRLFGTKWKVKSLTIIGCKLKDLSGINGFMNLQCLFVSYNHIQTLSDLIFNQTLRIIDLQGNLVDNMQEVEYLSTVDNLQMINLDHNPIMQNHGKQVIQLFNDKIETQYLDDEVISFSQNINDADMIQQNYQNVLLIDSLSKKMVYKIPYQQMIENIKKDKYAQFVEKQIDLDGRFHTETNDQSDQYLIDDLTIFYNPKKALEKDSIIKYLNLKFNNISQEQQQPVRAKTFMRRSSLKNSQNNTQQRKDPSITSSKVSTKNEDLMSTRGFNPSLTASSNNFTQTILSKPDSVKRKFILRKTSLKKDNNDLASTLQSPTFKRQNFYKTSSILNQ